MNYNSYDELYHHGIFGMKWGKKNGPPYPLKPGDHSASEKKAGWRKSLKDEHPDKKYFDSRNFGQDDLQRLTSRFNDEKAFNDALAAKLRSENMLDQDKFRNMSRKQRKELYQLISDMEDEAAYNRAYQQQIQSQIDLITSQRRLADLQRKPPTKFQQAQKAVGDTLKEIGKRSVTNVGTDAGTYLLGTAINKATGKNIVDTSRFDKDSRDNQIKKLKKDTDYVNAQVNLLKAQNDLKKTQSGEKSDDEQLKELKKQADILKNTASIYKSKQQISDYKSSQKQAKADKALKKQQKKDKKHQYDHVYSMYD